jgi:hypothetical protein
MFCLWVRVLYKEIHFNFNAVDLNPSNKRTLMSEQVLEILIGRVPKMIKPCYLPGYRRFPVRNFVFPGVIPCEQAMETISYFPKAVNRNLQLPPQLETNTEYVEGVLLTDLSSTEMQVFDWYEDTAYLRSVVSVWAPCPYKRYDQIGNPSPGASSVLWEKCDANIYLWANPLTELEMDNDWDNAYFLQNKLQWYLENTVIPCRKQLNALGIGVCNQ